jgi:hypothetical protein
VVPYHVRHDRFVSLLSSWVRVEHSLTMGSCNQTSNSRFAGRLDVCHLGWKSLSSPTNHDIPLSQSTFLAATCGIALASTATSSETSIVLEIVREQGGKSPRTSVLGCEERRLGCSVE